LKGADNVILERSVAFASDPNVFNSTISSENVAQQRQQLLQHLEIFASEGKFMMKSSRSIELSKHKLIM
jgi:hypothetical protein